MNKPDHVILLAHGSRDSSWCETFESGLASIRPALRSDTSLAYMEMASPTLEEVVARETAKGVRSFAVVPLFLAAGKHLLVDVPGQIEALQGRFAGLEMTLHEAIGKDPAFWEFLVTVLNGKQVEMI